MSTQELQSIQPFTLSDIEQIKSVIARKSRSENCYFIALLSFAALLFLSSFIIENGYILALISSGITLGLMVLCWFINITAHKLTHKISPVSAIKCDKIERCLGEDIVAEFLKAIVSQGRVPVQGEYEMLKSHLDKITEKRQVASLQNALTNRKVLSDV